MTLNPTTSRGGSAASTEIGYDQITAPVTITSTVESAGAAIISCAAHTFDGTAVVLEVYFPYVSEQVAVESTLVSLFESTTQIGRLCEVQNDAASDVIWPIYARYRFTPSAGSHTYVIAGKASSATGTIFGAGVGGTGAYLPAFARFSKA